MRKRPVYKCRICNRETAILNCIFVTQTKKFRARFHCPICYNNFEVTVNGEVWKILKYSNKEILKKTNIFLEALIKERGSII